MISPRRLLWVDCSAALSAGLAMFVLAGWLSGLYAVPIWAIRGMACVNIVYGVFSLTLAVRPRRPLAAIVLLATANAAWAFACGAAALVFFGSVSPWAVAHWVFEGLFVLWLAAMEWRQRHLLATDAPR